MKKYHKMDSETQVGIEKQSKLSEIAAPTLQYIQYRKSTHTILSSKNNEKKVRRSRKQVEKWFQKLELEPKSSQKWARYPLLQRKIRPHQLRHMNEKIHTKSNVMYSILISI